MMIDMKFIRIIAAVLALSSIVSCAIDGFDTPTSGLNSSDVITVVGRISRFDDCDVDTRGFKTDAEMDVSSIAMAIFRVNEDGTGLINSCVHYQYFANASEVLFAINRGDLDSSAEDYNRRYVIYAFANVEGMTEDDFGVGSTLDAMLAKAYDVKNANIPEKGFPMIGSLGDTFNDDRIDTDGQILILSPTDASGDLIGPTVDGVVKEVLPVPMKSMYAKINFTIEVNPTQNDENSSNPPQFEFEGYTINNIPAIVDFDKATNDDSNVIAQEKGSGITGDYILKKGGKLNFTFYLPERYLEPVTDTSSFPYPFKGTYDSVTDKNQNGIRDEDENLRQRFKGKLVEGDDNKKATYVVISGKYRDHQNHYFDVDYTIHLGENNFGDFNIRRNIEYNNFITIKGILNSNEGVNNDGDYTVAYDHRVNITRSQPAVISLRREMLLDSHFEIRPLRVKKSTVGDVYVNDVLINAVKVEIVDASKTNWMRLENKNDASGNSNLYLSNGKRKYFTYNLVNGRNLAGTADDLSAGSLRDSYSTVVPIDQDGECVWIYVDENNVVGDGVRSGVVKITYGNVPQGIDYTTGNFTPVNSTDYPEVSYTINQRNLFMVTDTTGVHDYYIEYEEEYLHNFDSEDSFVETEYEGMYWGLEEIQLSYDHKALYFESLLGLDVINNLLDYFNKVPAYYDFYVKSHDQGKLNPDMVTLHERAGYEFCNEIIDVVNGVGNHDTDPSNNIEVLALNQTPKSAVEYCYNKNKRNSDGRVAKVEWYLPAIDEIEEIVTSKYDYEGEDFETYLRFTDFQGKFYWSSQPAYIQNYAHKSQWYVFWTQDYYGNFYYDDIGNTNFDKDNETDRYNIGSARATRVYVRDNDYKSVPSGTNGYYSYFDADKDDNDPQQYQFTGSFNNRTIGTIEREEGNLARNAMARVRCVRKMD